MLRGCLSITVAVIPLCLPLSGGGSESGVRGPVARELALHTQSPAAPVQTALTEERPSVDLPLRALPPLREILFSFDDGPDLEGTPVVMDELDRRGLKGIFFVNGRHLVGNRPQDLDRRELVRRLVSHGHLVANHGFSHKNLCRQPETLVSEVDGNAEIITQSTGIRPELFRSPYGARCPSLQRAMAERDLALVGWDMDPQDWRHHGQDDIVEYVTRRLRRLDNKRAILLLHDTHPSAVRALPRILDWIEAENRRTARAGGTPIRISDYAHFFPGRDLPLTGLEPVLSDLAGALALLPGTSIARTRLGLR